MYQFQIQCIGIYFTSTFSPVYFENLQDHKNKVFLPVPSLTIFGNWFIDQGFIPIGKKKKKKNYWSVIKLDQKIQLNFYI